MDEPKCDKCGAEITTGFMAVFCPLAERCEFWVPKQAELLHELRGDIRGECEVTSMRRSHDRAE